jgi:hypothetical protein
MSDMIADGLAWLASQQQAHASKPVTVRSGDLSQSVTFNATFQSQLLRVSDGQGNTKIERTDADFTFPPSLLNFGSGVVEPAAGMFFDVVLAGVTTRFKVMPFGGGQEPPFRYCDAFRTQVRVHCKFFATL